MQSDLNNERMGVLTDSIPELFADLCGTFVHLSDAKANINQPVLSKYERKHKLKRRTYNALFQYLRGPHRPKIVSRHGSEAFREEEVIYSVCYELRCQQRFDEANKLELLLDRFNKANSTDDGRNFLRLLLCLSSNIPVERNDVFVPKIPILYPEKNDSDIFPKGPIMYGDTAVQTFSSTEYMNYPTHIFEANGFPKYDNISLQSSELDNRIFEMEPGSRLAGNAVFASPPVHPHTYLGDTRHSLFGALVHSTTSDLDVVLDIPDIPEGCTSLDVRVPKLPETSEDEGFVDTMSISTTSVCTVSPDLFSLKHEEDIWDIALKTERQRHYTWEHVGVMGQPKEKHFVSEGGDALFDKLYKVWSDHLKILDPDLVIPQTIYISLNTLIRDALNLLIGVPSSTFLFDEAKGEFCLQDGVSVSGTSPDGTRAMCDTLLEAGACYHRLSDFCKPQPIDSFYHSGLIFQAFTGALRKYMQYYRECILCIMEAEPKSLMHIKNTLYKVLEQIRYIAKLCHCDVNAAEKENPDEFPTGVKLLSYLYKEALDLASSHYYPLILSLLNSSCGPYVMFVQEWVFHGVCRDIYGEFMVQVRDDYLRFRNKMYWTHGYLMISKNVIDSVPLFLLGLANDIFVCGKSINLLRLCNPKHFLFGMESEVPRVMITFSEEDLSSIDKQCQGYLSRMQEIARQKTRSREEMLRRAEKAKHELVLRARQAANKELERLKGKVTAIREAEDKKKRRLFADLKKQMEKDLRRRASEKEDEKEEDKQRINDTARQELLENRVEEELEARARAELVEYYEKLSGEATLREQKALWHVRRRQLDIERIQFMQQEEASLAEELAQKPLMNLEEQKAIASGAPTDLEFEQWNDGSNGKYDVDTLPNWAQKPGDHPTELVEEGVPGKLNEAERPEWANKGLKNPGLEPVNEDVLPVWAKNNSCDTPVIVDDKTDVSRYVSTQKPHPSQSSMGNILQTEGHDPNKDWTDAKTVDDLGYRHVPTTEKPVTHHPSDSTAASLIYTEPERKEDRASKDASQTVDKSLVTDKDIGQSNDTEDPSLAIEAMNDTESPPASPVVTQGVADNQVTESPNKPEDGDKFSASEVDDVVFRKTGIKASLGALSKLESPTKTSIKVLPNPNKDNSKENIDKPSIRISEKRQVNSESGEEVTYQPHIKTSTSMTATKESVATDDAVRTHLRMIAGRNPNQMSEPQDEYISHLKTVANRHASLQTESAAPKQQLRFNPVFHASNETAPDLPKAVRQSMFGHISQLSRYEFDSIAAPKLKTIPGYHASLETARDEKIDRGFFVRTGRKKKVAEQSVGKQSERSDATDYRPKIKINKHQNMSSESELVDSDAARLEKFKKRNVFGHSSHSSVERLLYGSNYGTGKANLSISMDTMQEVEKADIDIWTDDYLDPFQTDFSHLDNLPRVDLLAEFTRDTFNGFGDFGISAEDDISAHEFVPLANLLKRSITAPLVAQISVVNQNIVNYFLGDLMVEKHLTAIRRFILMQDGEFGQSLGDQLFEKLATNPPPGDLLNPMYLNNVLSKAFRSSLHGEGELAKNISFALKFRPKFVSQNAPDAFDCLQLTYKVDWPLNIIITEGSMATYSRVFSFKLQLKRVVWVLTDVWHKLKRDAIIYRGSSGIQFRKLQLYRHDMQHFVKVMQEYMSNQIIHVSWMELQQDLNTHIHNLDDLQEVHRNYLNKCLSRCLLNKKAVTVMKIIQDIFGLILKFRMQLVCESWMADDSSGEVKHPKFQKLCETYKSFKDYSKFLFTVVNKLALRGYQPHLQELVLRLNYNSYYMCRTEDSGG